MSETVLSAGTSHVSYPSLLSDIHGIKMMQDVIHTYRMHKLQIFISDNADRQRILCLQGWYGPTMSWLLEKLDKAVS